MDIDVSSENGRPQPQAGRGALMAGGIAAILASTCCLGPLVLITLGFSGAWIGSLTALKPFRPVFIVLAVAALVLAWRRLWRPAACAPAEVCARPQVRRGYRLTFGAVALLVIVTLAFPYVAPQLY